MEKNIFEIATRDHYRFQLNGSLTVEDLWTLSVEKLDTIFKQLNKKIKTYDEESLLSVNNINKEELATKIEIVKYIAEYKIKQMNAAKDAQAKREKKQKIMEILSNKEDKDLENKSSEELMKILNDMDD